MGARSVNIHRNIRYAHASRFAPPQLLPYDGIVSSDRGPVPPQAPSRLEMVMGPAAPQRQSEECQVLSIFTPSRSGQRPVMVWFHGGGFVTGGGEMPWYDGERLAREQEVVVVSVTHRLGALGYLHFPASEGPSNGMADQVTALQWVQANIGAFGGDPGNVTVFGQSAGGFSIAAMLAWGHGGKLFRRAILQSGAGGLSRTRGEAETVSEQFVTLLGMDPHTASTDGFVAAQRKLAIARKQIADWMPILPETPTGAAVDMIGGWTRDDALPFVLIGAGVAPSPGTERQFTEQTQKMNGLFEAGCRALVGDMAARGQRAFLYRFAWAAQQSGLGACHCIDLPFLLGDRNSWSAAPMLSGTPWDEIESKGRTLRAAWANFARGETPGRNWTACSADAAPVTELD